jgi:hypothetical protein
LDVRDDDLVVDFGDRSSSPRERRDVAVVLLILCDRFVKDRGIRGHTRDAVLADGLGEVAAPDETALDLVEPDALAIFPKAAQGIGTSHLDAPPACSS